MTGNRDPYQVKRAFEGRLSELEDALQAVLARRREAEAAVEKAEAEAKRRHERLTAVLEEEGELRAKMRDARHAKRAAREL